jgi:hypothetical protein
VASETVKTSKQPSSSTAVASASTHNNPGWTIVYDTVEIFFQCGGTIVDEQSNRTF